MKDIVLFTSGYQTYERGKKAPGLHLNRFVRDILRECGYPCLNCNESCVEPDICDIISECSSGSSNDYNDLINLPTLTEVGGNVTGTINLDTGMFTLTALGGTYIGSSDTPLDYAAGDDIVPTINSTSDGLIHESNNKLHTSNLTYATLGSSTILSSEVDSFSFSPDGITVIGNKGFGDFSGDITLDGAGSFPATIPIELNLDNTGKKYPLSNPLYQVTILVNGAKVASVETGTLNSVIYSIPVNASTDIVTFFGTVNGTV